MTKWQVIVFSVIKPVRDFRGRLI